MKHLHIIAAGFLFAALKSAAAPAVVGQVANDIPYSLGSATLSGNNFASLSQSNFSAHEGKIIVVCYYTPW
jgi:hypothetical protein